MRLPLSGTAASLSAALAFGFALRALAVIAAVVALAGAACSGGHDDEDITIRLHVTVWPYGMGTGKRSYTWTLGCNPLGGTLPHGDRACFELATDPKPFATVPDDRVCLQIYGGPAVARVVGSLRGGAVDATFSRTDSCQLDRWDRVGYLFPRYV